MTPLQPLQEQLIDGLPLGVLVVERSGAVKFTNPCARELLECEDLDLDDAVLGDLVSFDPADPDVPAPVFSAEHRDAAFAVSFEEFDPNDASNDQLRAFVVRPWGPSMEGLGRFVAMLGHELRNPLAPIRLAAEHLRAAGAQPEEACQTIERQVAHLSHLLDNMLDVGRTARSRLAVELEPMLIRNAIDAGVEACTRLLERRNHTLHVQISDIEDAEVRGDVVRLTQVVSNLLANAAKHTPDGGNVSIEGTCDGDNVVLKISDDGRGIDANLLEVIFDPFVQARQGIARIEGGLGLGLPVVRHIVALHGGDVTASSDGKGRGACFTVTLRGHKRSSPSKTKLPMTSSTESAPSHRVLIVDDNEDAASMLALVLDSQGASCTVAGNGEDALQLMADQQFDLAIVDIGLPGVDGFEVARRSSKFSTRPARMIGLSGYGQQSDRTRAREAGFDNYFVKPIAADALNRLLQSDD